MSARHDQLRWYVDHYAKRVRRAVRALDDREAELCSVMQLEYVRELRELVAGESVAVAADESGTHLVAAIRRVGGA